MPSRDRKPVNVKPIYKRLIAERDRLERAALHGDVRLPDFGHDQGIPLWFVIQRLLDFKDAHRRRVQNTKHRRRERKQMVLNATNVA